MCVLACVCYTSNNVSGLVKAQGWLTPYMHLNQLIFIIPNIQNKQMYISFDHVLPTCKKYVMQRYLFGRNI